MSASEKGFEVRVIGIAFFLIFTIPLFALDVIVVPDQAFVPIKTPAFAHRHTAKIKLPNGLEVYLVSDPAAEKSAAGLCVQTGSWDDPTDIPGMAHFVEHMLFLGTVKYPEESAFDRFVSQHGGESNAQTGELDTCYFFSIDTSAFVEGLDRFASFFREPLFNPPGVAREISAIDQEFVLRSRMDFMRQWAVLQELAHPAHPFHRFTMGNAETLASVPRDRLLDWYQKHYSANLMHLIVYSPLPLDQLQPLTVKNFAAIPNRDKAPSQFDVPMTDGQLQGTISWIEPIQHERSLTLFWELPKELVHTLSSRPDDLIGYVLGHEGSRSLLAELKREKLAEGIICGTLKLGNDQSIFMLRVELTKAGLAHYQTVIERCFQAIATLRRKGIPRALFDDFQQIEKLRYQYQMRDKAFTFVEKYAQILLKEPLTTFPEQSFIIQRYDPEKIQSFINALPPQRAHISIVAPQKESGVVMDRKEHWLDVSYRVEKVPVEQMALWSRVALHPDMDLPVSNAFIPKHLLGEIAATPSQDKVFSMPLPKLVVDEGFGKVYFAQDHLYGVPSISWSLRLLTPLVNSGDVLKTVMADLYIKSLTESLTDISYDAEMAGLQFEVKRDYFGILITLNGYSENALLLLRQVLERLKAVRPDAATFRIYKDAQRIEYVNASRDTPLVQARNLLKDALFKQYVMEGEKAKAIRSVDHEQFLEYVANLFRHNYSQLMLYGDMGEANVTAAWRMLRQSLDGDPFPIEEHPRLEVAQLESPFAIEMKAKTKGNAIILAIADGPFSFENFAIQQLLSQAMKASFYATLRTQQQTAYSLDNWQNELERNLFSFFAASSSSHLGQDLLSRFELFIEGFLQQLGHEGFSQSDFDTLREVLATNLDQPPESLSEMGKLLYDLAFNHDADFIWKKKQAQALRQLTFPDFLSGSRAILGKDNRKRLAVLIKGELSQGNALEYRTAKNPTVFREKTIYSNSH